jgi:hypothetical protein
MYKFMLLCCFGLQAGQESLYPSLEGIGGSSVLEAQPVKSSQPNLYGGLLEGLQKPLEVEADKEPEDSASKEGGPQVEEPDGGCFCDKMEHCAKVGECCCECVKCAGCTGAALVGCMASTSTRIIAGTRRIGTWICAIF